MTKPMKYTLCEVTRTEETESRTDEVICIGLLDLPGLLAAPERPGRLGGRRHEVRGLPPGDRRLTPE